MMVNIDVHKVTLIKILKEIYSDVDLRGALGFKGGTAALLFYDLPRFSIDLDFDLLKPEQGELVFAKLRKILPKFGQLKDASEKQNTFFLLLSYQKGERNLKLEVSKRASASSYEVKQYLGIPMLVMKQGDMTAGKLSALLTRSKFAARDIFDLWFFLKHSWSVNEEVVREKTGLSLKEAINKAEKVVENLKRTQLLSGLGDLLDDKQKIWVRENLQQELLFLLRLYKTV